MTRLRILFFSIGFILLGLAVAAQETDTNNNVPYDKNGSPVLSCKAACLIAADSGQILYRKNPYSELPNASTTKLMTAVLVMEHLSMDDMLTASKNVSQTQYTSLYLSEGEQISVRDALAGAILRSANDSAVLFAEAISGNVKNFSNLMNDKAAELGMKNTHFVNPHGLYDENHYSSAYDLCLLGREAAKYPEILELAQKRSYILRSRTINKENLLIRNKTRFTKLYPYATGLKAGFTKQSGNCFVGSAEKNGIKLISCILGSPNITNETTALMDYGFGHFHRNIIFSASKFNEVYPVANSSQRVACKLAGDLVVYSHSKDNANEYEYKFIVPNDLKAPIKKGQRIGAAKVFKGYKEYCSIDIVAAESVKANKVKSIGVILAGIGIFLWKIVRFILLLILSIIVLTGVINVGRKIAENHRKNRFRFKKKMRRNDHRRAGHGRRTASRSRPKGRPRY